MTRTKANALLLGAIAAAISFAPVTSFAYTSPTPAPIKSAPNVSDWYSHFFWTFTNSTPQTITNVNLAHSTKNGVDYNNYVIQSIAPGQTVGPFWGDWHSAYEDVWVLQYHNPLYDNFSGRNTVMTGGGGDNWKKCSVEENDLGGNPIQVILTKNPANPYTGVGSALINIRSGPCEANIVGVN